MNLLFVTQKSQDGSEKVYRFHGDRERVMLGSSRKADIRLPASMCEKIEGCLEFENGSWTYHSFTMNDKVPVIVSLKTGAHFRIGEYVFSTEMIEQKSLFDEAATEGELGDQIVLALFNGSIFHSEYVTPGQSLSLELAGEKLQIQTRETRSWISEVQGSFEIRQKTLARHSKAAYRQNFQETFNLSKQDKYILGTLSVIFVLGLCSMGLMPTPKMEIAKDDLPKSTQPLVLKMVPPTERQAAQAPGEKSQTQNRISRIQDLSQSIAKRAGQFLKKATRMPSSIGPNGTLIAPAMGVSRLDGPSTDWNAAAGQQVSGQIGGKLGGTGGNARLSGNGVGTSGVNLLDQESEITGGLDREVIADFIRRHIGHILYCYERSLSANPNLFGKVAVRFVIGASGQVETQKIGESTLKDARVESCILEKVSQWKFPTPKNGVQVSVNYPFLFKTTN